MTRHNLPSHWRWTTLDDVAAPIPNAIVDGPFGSNLKVSDYVESGVPVLQGKNITDDRFQWFDVRYISERKASELRRSSVRAGDILIVKIGSIGYSAIVPNLPDHTFAIIPANLAKMTPNGSLVDTKYLHHWLRTSDSKSYLNGVASKTAQPALSLTKIKELAVPLPPLAEQRRIAVILDQAEALRAKRRHTLAQLDTLIQSLFLDLFGDPATNPKKWDYKSISQIGRVITGNTPSRAKPDYYGTAIEWVKSDNINTPHHYLTKADEGLSEEGRAVARTVPPGSILVTCIAGSPSCIGNAAITDREVAFNQQINALVPQHSDVRFLYTQILVGKHLIQEAATAAMKGMISKSRFEEIRLIFPPLDMQQPFGSAFERIEKLKTSQQASLAKLDALFASLQHRAFRGEL